MIPSAVFVPAVAIQTTFHSPAKFWEIFSWGYAEDIFTCFVGLEKAYDQVPCEKLWGNVVCVRCWRPPVNGRQVTIFFLIPVSGELNHNRSQLVLESDKGVCCLHSFS